MIAANVREADLIAELTAEQLDHVALGMERAFGATLTKRSPIEFTLESGKTITIHPGSSASVLAVWQTAEALSQ